MSIIEPRGSGPQGPIFGYEPPVTARLDEAGGGVPRAVAGLAAQRREPAVRSGTPAAAHTGVEAYEGFGTGETGIADDGFEDDAYPEDLVQAAWDMEYEGDESDAFDDEDAYEYGEWTEAEIAAFHASASSGGLGRVGAWAGAMTSVALVAGLAVWGYDLAMRDLNGVPVVAALEGPMRTAPEDPQGTQMAHQGFALNEIQAEGAAGATPDVLRLAPPPAGLSAEDIAAVEEPVDDGLLDIDFSEADLTSPEAAEAAEELAAQIAAAAEPLEGLAPLGEVGPVLEAQETSAQAPAVIASGPGLKVSLRPIARPTRGVAAATAEITDIQTTSATTREVDPGSIAPGTFLVQVGAFPTRDLAMTEWARLEGRFGPYFDGKGRLVAEANSGGRNFFRLRAVGFEDMASARGFCAALLAGSADCIPVVSR